MKRIFNFKNFIRALVFAISIVIISKIVDAVFRDETDWELHCINASVMFLISLLMGAENLSWKELFFGKKKNNIK